MFGEIMSNSVSYNFWKILRKTHLISQKKFIRKSIQFTPEYEIIKNSEYFDKEWYLNQNPDLAQNHKDPIAHYLLKGWKAGVSPSVKFDNNDYIYNHQEIYDKNINPLIHYENYGKEKGYKICPHSTLPQDKKLSTDGISIVANLVNVYGLGQVGRDIVSALNLSNMQYDIKSTYKPGKPIVPEEEYKKIKTTPYLRYKTRLLLDDKYSYYEPDYNDIKAIWWEFTSGLTEFRPNTFDGAKTIIAFSDFCYNYFKNIAPQTVKLCKVNYPFNKNWTINKTKEASRRLYHLKNTDFVCFFNFDYRSSYIRKNPEGAIKAFANALRDKSNAYLVIKTVGYDAFPDLVKKLEQLASQLNVKDKIIFINDYLSRNDLMTLINSCDVYLSLHRGEGLGLGMLEAMSMGIPVIGTNYGGNTEFMNSDNSCLVEYQMVPAKEYDVPPYQYVKEYAEPNLEQATHYIKLMYENQEYKQSIGEKAQNFVDTYFNIETFKQQISNIIKECA